VKNVMRNLMLSAAALAALAVAPKSEAAVRVAVGVRVGPPVRVVAPCRVHPPYRGAVWVPGHYDRFGIWIGGHWRG
jgi:hypothetical protein